MLASTHLSAPLSPLKLSPRVSQNLSNPKKKNPKKSTKFIIKASKTSTQSVIKLTSGAGSSGTVEESPGPSASPAPPPLSPPPPPKPPLNAEIPSQNLEKLLEFPQKISVESSVISGNGTNESLKIAATMSVNQSTKPPPDDIENPPPKPKPAMSGSVAVQKSVFPLNQSSPKPPSPGVITSAPKITAMTSTAVPKPPKDPQKPTSAPTSTPLPSTPSPILTTRIVQKSAINQQPTTSKLIMNSALPQNAQKLQVTYEALQVSTNGPQQSAVIQSCQQIGKTLTGVTNLQRLPSNAKLLTPTGYQKVRTLTTGLNNQTGVLQKNIVSRVQVPKAQLTGAITPIVNQVIAVNNAQRYPTNATITLKSQCPKMSPGNNENQQNHKIQLNQVVSKTPGPSKTQALQGAVDRRQKQMNSVKKVAVDLQKITNNQSIGQGMNAQLASISGNQNRNLSTNFVKSDGNCNQGVNSGAKTATVTVVNKGQMQGQILPQSVQMNQMNQMQKQNVPRPQNVSIQPKLQQLSLQGKNAGTGAVINAAKMQQPQMLLRLESGKSIGVQGSNVKVTQKPIVKNSQCLQQQNVPRNVSAQPVKIIQQNSGGYQQAQIVGQKQPGCIKTLPPQNRGQGVKGGIKTSLNTNINALKTIATSGTTVITQKGNIKTILPHQNASNVVVQKGQQIKIQGMSMQKQVFVTSPFSQQHQRQGQIKTILPVVSAEGRRDEGKEEAGLAGREDEENEEDEEEELKAQSPVRRMPLPYECLQFVLQDHNYGAPPPRTPPPTSPTIKQQPINGGAGPTLPHQSFIYNQGVSISNNTADDAASAISSEPGREVEPEGEETETAPEGEGDEEDSITRCICEFEHDDGYMICCDRCLVWQHVDCMGIDRSNIPDEYLCEICRPRRVDRQRARALQMRKREELLNSDTSSDTSSTTSAETSVPPVPNPKKRANVPQTSRKKAEPPQPRRLNNNNNNNNNDSSNNNAALSVSAITNTSTTPNPSTDVNPPNSIPSNGTTNNPPTPNNNNNVTKRPGRRETPRQTSVQARKKEVPKRGPGKRKGKRRRSTDNDDENTETWGTNMAPLRQWIERYEEAVTNHYSPELRARISSIKVNGTHNDFRQNNNNNMSASAIGKCRVNVNTGNVKYLMATVYLPQNTPVVELRGKYMLSTQHRPTNHGQGRQSSQRPGPFVFFYRLPREGTEVCVDTRTYGNDARFVRRSCTPNAEVKHCIEKGTLHLYIVTTSAIEKNTEITIKHEQHNLLMSPNSSSMSPLLPVSCACGNSRTCQLTVAVGQVATRRSSSGASADNSDGRERRRRGRKSVVSDDNDAGSSSGAGAAASALAGASASASAIPSASVSASASTSLPTTPASDVTPSGIPGATPKRTPEIRDKSKEEIPQVAQLPPSIDPLPPHPVEKTSVQASSSPTDVAPPETKKDKKKMTREERKMEAIMKAFERLEKAEQRKQEVQARNAQRKESGGAPSDNDDPITSHVNKSQKQERPRRKRRKGRARTTSSSQQSSRRTRLNSADSDLSSGDDDHLIGSPPHRRQQHSSIQSSQIYSPKNDNLLDSSGQNQVIPTAAGLLLALANSNVPDSSRSMSPTLQQPAPSKSPTCDSGASSSSQSSTPSTPLSSACLLVAAAVGPLAPGFKFPKTKKAMMNEWLRESPDLTPLPQKNLPIISPTGLISKESPKELSSDFLTNVQSMNYGNKSLATLVQAANSVSGICDSPPQRKGNCPNSVVQNQQCPVSSGSAKKRWLRQAISEECDSPNSRPESPPNETVAAPPKKRRIARESLSSDNYTPPTTPTPSGDAATNLSANASLSASALGLLDVQSGGINENYQDRQMSSSHVDSPLTLEGQMKSYLDCEMKDEEMKEEMDLKKSEFHDNFEKNEMIEESSPVKTTIKSEDSMAIDQIHPIDAISPKIEENVKVEVKSEADDSTTTKDEPMETSQDEDDGIKTEVKLEESEEIKEVVEESPDDKPDEKMDDESSMEVTEPETPEFDSNSVSEPIPSTLEPKKEEKIEKIDETSREDSKLEEPMSIDEFDVEAQMKKITGDDGNDYKEKISTSSERDKSFDGIEGLMESSKEDSDTSDVDLPVKQPVKQPEKIEERVFKEFETLASLEVLNSKDSVKKTETCSTSEESMFDSISNLDGESAESPKIFASIPPLSERIRKKTEAPPKKQLDFEAAIIESTIDMETVELANGEHKTELSTALRELLETKIDDETGLINSMNTMAEEGGEGEAVLQSVESSSPISSGETGNSGGEGAEKKEEVLPETSVVSPTISEVKRLKDPRTATPAERAVPEVKPTPVKRKLSISEYRKRKQQSSGGTPPEPSNDASSSDKSPGRGRSDSASSGTSSLSSDDENAKAAVDTAAALGNLAIFAAADAEERKVKLQEVKKGQLVGQQHRPSWRDNERI